MQRQLSPAKFFGLTIILAAVLLLSVQVTIAQPQSSIPSDGPCSYLIGNGGFETGDFSQWATTGSPWVVDDQKHSGTYSAALGDGDSENESVYQHVTIPGSATSAVLRYWSYIETEEGQTTAYDRMWVEAQSVSGEVLAVLEVLDNTWPLETWRQSYVDLMEITPDLLGRAMRLAFHAVTDGSNRTTFYVDDVALEVCEGICSCFRGHTNEGSPGATTGVLPNTSVRLHQLVNDTWDLQEVVQSNGSGQYSFEYCYGRGMFRVIEGDPEGYVSTGVDYSIPPGNHGSVTVLSDNDVRLEEVPCGDVVVDFWDETDEPACPDEWEPNDGFGEDAIWIEPGISIDSYICHEGDVDYFRFEVGAGWSIEVDLVSLPLDYDVVLYDSGQTEIGRSAYSGITAEQIIHQQAVGGTYTVEVYGYGGAHHASDPYTLLVTLWGAPVECMDEFEVNDSIEEAWDIEAGELIESYICDVQDLDYFRFEVGSGQTIQVDLSGLPRDYDLALYGSDAGELQRSAAGGTAAEQIVWTTAVGGSYYAHVYGYGGAHDPEQPYSLQVELSGGGEECPDTYESNNWFDEAIGIASGDEVNSYVCGPEDMDFFWFEADEGQEVTVTLDGLAHDASLELYGSEQELIGWSYNVGTADEEIVHVALGGGVYYVKVYGTQQDEVNAYRLRVILAGGGPECPGDLEPNGQFDEPWIVPADTSLQSYICGAEDVDYFGFEVDVGEEIVIVLDGPLGQALSVPVNELLPADYDLYLFRPDDEENYVAFSNTDDLVAETIYHQAEMTGLYRAQVVVKPGQQPSSLPYQLRWSKGSGTLVVNTTDDLDKGICSKNHCSLREALNAANMGAGKRIEFAILGGHQTDAQGHTYWVISPATNLPPITADGVVIDGTSQAKFVGGDPNPLGPEIQLQGTQISPPAFGLQILSNNTVIQELSIGGFGQTGVVIQGNGNALHGDFIGLDYSGARVLPNGDGVEILLGGSNNSIGDASSRARNVISGNTRNGVAIRGSGCSGNIIQGNFIGLDRLGFEHFGNSLNGVVIENGASENIVGGGSKGSGNTINANGQSGVVIQGHGTNRNEVLGNLISGTGMGNGQDGVRIQDGAQENRIGGRSSSERNYISANAVNGLSIVDTGTAGNVVVNNYIGTDHLRSRIGNGACGVYLGGGATGNTVGGTDDADRNVISANLACGIMLTGAGTRHNKVLANYVGTDINGSMALGNGGNGVHISDAKDNEIGGPTRSVGNLISGNGMHGVFITGGDARGNLIQGNYIGTDTSGLVAISNAQSGVYIQDGAHENLIGGTAQHAGNLISGNNMDGVAIAGGSSGAHLGTRLNRVQGNTIGLAADSSELGNRANGVAIRDGAQDNLIGGTDGGNTISANGANGVHVEGANTAENTVSMNSIYGHLLPNLGIDLDSGANSGITPPTVTALQPLQLSKVRIIGKTCPGCILELFGDDGDEGRAYVSSTVANATTGDYVVDLQVWWPFFSLTASDLNGNTSEFSRDALPDVFIAGIEVTQAIQDLDNNVFLVKDKATTARVHLGMDSLPGISLPRVTAVLTTKHSSDGGATWQTVNTKVPDNPGEMIAARTDPDRGDASHSFYFNLDPQWLNGYLDLEVTLDPRGASADRDTSNNHAVLSKPVTFVEVPPMHLQLVDVQHSFTATVNGTETFFTTTATITDFLAIEDWLTAAYPIPHLDVLRSTASRNDEPSNSGVNALLAQLKSSGSRHKNTFYYGLIGDCGGLCVVGGMAGGIPSFVASGSVGDPANQPTRTTISWDVDSSYGDWLAGHELGHSMGRYHTIGEQPGTPGRCGGEYGGVDQYPNGRIGGPASDTSRYAGWDTNLDRAYGSDWHDIMTYCQFRWPSNMSYETFRNRLYEIEGWYPLQSAAPVQTFFVVGTVDVKQDTAQLGPGYKLTSDAPPIPPVAGEYALRLEDGSGSSLADTPFEIPHHDPIVPDDDALVAFSLEVPWDPATARIVLLHNGVELAERFPTDHAPTVVVLEPAGTSYGSEPMAVTWAADDQDGDDLSFVVQYSADGGLTWDAVAAGLSETTLMVDLGNLPGGDQCLVRVKASDGVNVGTGESDTPFRVPLKSPLPRIQSPIGGWFTPSQNVIVRGSAYDPEDGTLEDGTLRWSSDRDGHLGAGRAASFSGLSSGEHRLTLTATDSDGMQGIDTVSIYVGEQPRGQQYFPLVHRGH